MKYQIFNLKNPSKVVRTVESTSRQDALARAGCAPSDFGAIPIRESAGHRVRLQLQEPGVPVRETAGQRVRHQEPGVPVRETAGQRVRRQEQDQRLELQLENSFRRMGLSESAAKIAAKGR